jgi:hypothetical protein
VSGNDSDPPRVPVGMSPIAYALLADAAARQGKTIEEAFREALALERTVRRVRSVGGPGRVVRAEDDPQEDPR